MRRVKIVKILQVRQGIAKYNSRIKGPNSIVRMVEHLFKGLDREIFIVVGLNIRGFPNTINMVSIGNQNSTYATPIDVFKPLILSNCAAFICMHNHISGTIEPSPADKECAKRLADLGKMMGIELLDFIIFGDTDNYYSFHMEGLISSSKSNYEIGEFAKKLTEGGEA
jgi:DNA repair protein RadC